MPRALGGWPSDTMSLCGTPQVAQALPCLPTHSSACAPGVGGEFGTWQVALAGVGGESHARFALTGVGGESHARIALTSAGDEPSTRLALVVLWGLRGIQQGRTTFARPRTGPTAQGRPAQHVTTLKVIHSPARVVSPERGACGLVIGSNIEQVLHR